MLFSIQHHEERIIIEVPDQETARIHAFGAIRAPFLAVNAPVLPYTPPTTCPQCGATSVDVVDAVIDNEYKDQINSTCALFCGNGHHLYTIQHRIDLEESITSGELIDLLKTLPAGYRADIQYIDLDEVYILDGRPFEQQCESIIEDSYDLPPWLLSCVDSERLASLFEQDSRHTVYVSDNRKYILI